MADLKISQLTGATTPLAGTEVLPIVQSGSTRQVSVANLTAGRTQTSNGVVQGAAGTGYNFTANTPAAGMTSQLLNWYEEGTFTPAVIGTVTAGTGTYNSNGQIGRYTRIGNRVIFNIWLSWSAHTGSGAMRVSGLPFTANSANAGLSAVSTYNSDITLPANSYLQAYVNPGTNVIYLNSGIVGGGTAGLIGLDTSGDLMLSGQYII